MPRWMICLFVNQTSVYLSNNDNKLIISHLLFIQCMTKHQMKSRWLCVCLKTFKLELDNVNKVMGLMYWFPISLTVPVHITALHCLSRSPSSGNSTLQKTDEEVIETEVKQDWTDERSLDEALRCCVVKARSPAGSCFVSPPSFFQLRSASNKTCVRINTPVS